MEVIKEWNTSSRGNNGGGRNRAEPVEERKSGAFSAAGLIKRQARADVWENLECFEILANI